LLNLVSEIPFAALQSSSTMSRSPIFHRAVPFYSDGKPGPAIELRDLFEQFLNEVEGNK
jgi:hypothetical protein